MMNLESSYDMQMAGSEKTLCYADMLYLAPACLQLPPPPGHTLYIAFPAIKPIIPPCSLLMPIVEPDLG